MTSLKTSLSNSFHDFYEEYGLEKKPNLSAKKIAKEYYGWLVKWAPYLARDIDREMKGDKSKFWKIVKNLVEKQWLPFGHCCKDASMECQYYGGTDYRHLCTNCFCDSHGMPCPLCEHGVCERCVEQCRYFEDLQCCNFAKTHNICPDCVFKCIDCHKENLCSQHRAYIVIVNELSEETSVENQENIHHGNGYGVCIDCAFQQSTCEEEITSEEAVRQLKKIKTKK